MFQKLRGRFSLERENNCRAFFLSFRPGKIKAFKNSVNERTKKDLFLFLPRPIIALIFKAFLTDDLGSDGFFFFLVNLLLHAMQKIKWISLRD